MFEKLFFIDKSPVFYGRVFLAGTNLTDYNIHTLLELFE